MDWGSEEENEKCLGVLYERACTLCLSKLEPLGSFRGCSYIHGSRSVLTPFTCSLSLVLRIEIFNLRITYLHVSLHMNLFCERTYMSSSEREESVKGKWQHREACCSDEAFCLYKLEHLTPKHWLIPYATGLPIHITVPLDLEREHCWFSFASLLLRGDDRVLEDACGWVWWQGDAVSEADCPSSFCLAIKKALFKEKAYFWACH